MAYQLIDCGEGRKLEQIGPYSVDRPCLQAVWRRQKREAWHKADLRLVREGNRTVWQGVVPKNFVLDCNGLKMEIRFTDFGHIGLFLEHQTFWDRLRHEMSGKKALNLFAYTGAATLCLAQGGAQVCHVDSSKGIVQWARENARHNGLDKAPIRWIVEDALKFLRREVKRGVRYDWIMLDPPSFGRGPKGEVFKIEEKIAPLLEACAALEPEQILFSCHTPGWTPFVLEKVLSDFFPRHTLTSQELFIQQRLVSGSYVQGEWRGRM